MRAALAHAATDNLLRRLIVRASSRPASPESLEDDLVCAFSPGGRCAPSNLLLSSSWRHDCLKRPRTLRDQLRVARALLELACTACLQTFSSLAPPLIPPLRVVLSRQASTRSSALPAVVQVLNGMSTPIAPGVAPEHDGAREARQTILARGIEFTGCTSPRHAMPVRPTSLSLGSPLALASSVLVARELRARRRDLRLRSCSSRPVGPCPRGRFPTCLCVPLCELVLSCGTRRCTLDGRTRTRPRVLQVVTL